MKIHKAGYRIIAITTLVLFALAMIVYYIFSPWFYICYPLYMLGILVLFFTVRFFRNPQRDIEINKNAIYAPADGKIVVIEKLLESKYLHENRIQISIFMSPMNVHVNYYPISGEVVLCDYYPGDKMLAWHPKSSELNEHSSVVIEDNEKRKVLVKQIAGAMARRIICKAKEGETVQQGDELGIIKFGSRVDVLLPMNVRVNVDMKEKVVAKKTILAYFE
ncbi:MAG: phosphatidylserine decarboxylase family protein [Bacteroidales bacterium]|jgi:phosphatidylserine decarboxylase|nr:phosphatidylserine decarboxylase family protein [Bacteroidales bacterium]